MSYLLKPISGPLVKPIIVAIFMSAVFIFGAGTLCHVVYWHAQFEHAHDQLEVDRRVMGRYDAEVADLGLEACYSRHQAAWFWQDPSCDDFNGADLKYIMGAIAQ